MGSRKWNLCYLETDGEGCVWFAHSESRMAANGILTDTFGAIFKDSALFLFDALVKIFKCF